jgi:hypothetical protein
MIHRTTRIAMNPASVTARMVPKTVTADPRASDPSWATSGEVVFMAISDPGTRGYRLSSRDA